MVAMKERGLHCTDVDLNDILVCAAHTQGCGRKACSTVTTSAELTQSLRVAVERRDPLGGSALGSRLYAGRSCESPTRHHDRLDAGKLAQDSGDRSNAD